MWIVDAPSPASSVPPSPGIAHHVPPFSLQGPNDHSSPLPARSGSTSAVATPSTPSFPISVNPGVAGVSASQLPGAGMSGHLSGVISLTDVLNILARASGLSPGDPEATRRRRRRSSSSSLRASIDAMRSSQELRRPSSASGRR